MLTHANIQAILKNAEDPFSIIEEFSMLAPRRKVVLCENLFSQSRGIFQKTVKLIWPQASMKDMKKLERFLFILKNAAH